MKKKKKRGAVGVEEEIIKVLSPIYNTQGLYSCYIILQVPEFLFNSLRLENNNKYNKRKRESMCPRSNFNEIYLISLDLKIKMN